MDSLSSHLVFQKEQFMKLFPIRMSCLKVSLNGWLKTEGFSTRILDDSDNAIAAIFKMLEFTRDHLQDMSPAFSG